MNKSQLEKVKRTLPSSWRKAAGFLRGRRQALEKHVAQTKQEWRQL